MVGCSGSLHLPASQDEKPSEGMFTLLKSVKSSLPNREGRGCRVVTTLTQPQFGATAIKPSQAENAAPTDRANLGSLKGY